MWTLVAGSIVRGLVLTWSNGLYHESTRPIYPSTSRIQPLTIAIVKPRKRRLVQLWTMKRTSDREKRARKRLLAGNEGRYAQ